MSFTPSRSAKAGFTIIEIAIVMLIVGFLVAGILVGRDLVHQAELRSVLSDVSKYTTAVQTFRATYDCLPGDCRNATNFWGAEAVCPDTPYTATPHTAVCNGNGDGVIGTINDWTDMYEIFRFWQELANAHLIGGSYSGISAPAARNQGAVTVVNTPPAGIANSTFIAYNLLNAGPNIPTWFFTNSVANAYLFGTNSPAGGSYIPYFPVITGGDALALDQKIDDGLPATGHVFTYMPTGPSTDPLYTAPPCVSSTVAAAATYITTDNQIRCQLWFDAGF
jgi:hypothetical protein